MLANRCKDVDLAIPNNANNAFNIVLIQPRITSGISGADPNLSYTGLVDGGGTSYVRVCNPTLGSIDDAYTQFSIRVVG